MSESRKRAQLSTWVTASQSGIHGRGLFAHCAIPAGTRVIEYVGRRINKRESERLERRRLERARRGGDDSIYAFVLNSRVDIDGGVPWNLARLANHSCAPNCVTRIIRGRIWIIALRDIAAGDEITYDYNFDWELCRDHRCLCGAVRCPGFIVRTDLRWRLRRRLSREKAAA
jgi:SET domain-containing protein